MLALFTAQRYNTALFPPSLPMRYFSLLFMLLLNACQAPFPAEHLPQLAEGDVRRFRLDRVDAQGNIMQSSLLVVQGQQNGISRWIQTDAFGAPQARLTATRQGWQRDGFIAPNRRAQALFQAVFPLLDQPENAVWQDWRITPLPDTHE